MNSGENKCFFKNCKSVQSLSEKNANQSSDMLKKTCLTIIEDMHENIEWEQCEEIGTVM